MGPYCSAHTHQPPTDQIWPQTMKVLLFLAGLLLCLHISEGFTYRGSLMRNRNRGGGRSYLRNLGGGRQRMGGMGFGKRASNDFYYPDSDYFDELDDDELERLEEAAKVLDMEEEAAEAGGETEKRSLSSLRGFTGRRSSYKRGISSLKGKRGLGMALSSLRSRGRGKRGALSSLRNQGFVKYNI